MRPQLYARIRRRRWRRGATEGPRLGVPEPATLLGVGGRCESVWTVAGRHWCDSIQGPWRTSVGIAVGNSGSGVGLWTSNRQNLALVAVVMLPAVLVIVASRHGLGLTADSVGYMAAARSFAADREFTYWDGTPFTHWPPGLPLILGVFLKAGVDPLGAAFILNVIAVGALVALTYAIARQLIPDPKVALVPAALIAIALSTVRVYSQLWTEPLFIVSCLTTVWLLTRMIRNGMSISGVVAVAACVSLACSLRFMGLALLPVVGISLLTAEYRQGLLRALTATAAAVALAGIGAVVVVLRNLILVGSLTGSSSTSSETLRHAVRTILATIGDWIAPDARVGLAVAVLAGIAIIGMATVGMFFLARSVATRRLAVPLVAFIASYPFVLLVSSLRVNVDLDFRTVAPLMPPVAIVVVAGMWNLSLLATRGRSRRWASMGLSVVWLAAIGVYLAGNTLASVSFALEMGRSGAGYNSVQKLSSQLARAAGSFASAPGLLTNDPQHVYWVTGRHPIPGGVALAKTGDAAAAVRAQIEAGTITHFADFTDSRTLQGISAERLRSWGVLLEDPVSYPEGTLYRLTVSPAR